LSSAASLKNLHEFTDHPAKFWPEYLAFACQQAMAQRCTIFARKADSWKQLYQFSIDQRRFNFSDDVNDSLANVADKCLQEGQIHAQIKESQLTLLGIRLEGLEQPSVAIFFLHATPAISADELLQRLQLLVDTPAIYLRHRDVQETEQELARFADVLDLLLLLNSEEHYVAATMTLANELAARYQCSRVCLGWQQAGYIRLQTISHMERFDPKMDAVTSLEAAMEETYDQDEEILLPQPATSNAVTRDHSTYAELQQVRHLLTLPLRDKEQPIAVLSCERADRAFSEEEIRGLRIICDQVAPRLVSLKESDRWFGAQLADKLRKQASGLLGAEHTLLKVSAVLIFLLLLLSLVVHLPYRVEAPFIIRSEDVQQVSTPFEGYIEEVHVKIGQQVEKDQPLLSLDTRDLQLEESAALANQIRYLREAEKARAFGSLIDMKIAQAQADQAKAQLDLIRYHLEQAEIRSTMAGVIVEGDLEELRGAPVSKGDILFKVARHEKLFIELKIDEKDIHELATGQQGEIAFVSQPGIKYPIGIEQIDPVAQADDAGNSFVARASNTEIADKWWRPGMSGIAKIEVGDRSIIWMLTHRTFDFFQMLIWW
jgi:biotin carboxyl carrier protein